MEIVLSGKICGGKHVSKRKPIIYVHSFGVSSLDLESIEHLFFGLLPTLCRRLECQEPPSWWTVCWILEGHLASLPSIDLLGHNPSREFIRWRREPIGIFTILFLNGKSWSPDIEPVAVPIVAPAITLSISNQIPFPGLSKVRLGIKGTNGKLLLLRQALDRDPLQLTLKLIMRAKAVNISIRH